MSYTEVIHRDCGKFRGPASPTRWESKPPRQKGRIEIKTIHPPVYVLTYALKCVLVFETRELLVGFQNSGRSSRINLH